MLFGISQSLGLKLAMLMLTLGEYTPGWKKAWYLGEITFFGGVKLLL
jgi:hypothetical protein